LIPDSPAATFKANGRRNQRSTTLGKNDRLSRDQKRKIKLKKRDERSSKPEPLAYHGRKYKTAAFVPIIYQTEIGIYECHIMYRKSLTDDEVEAALVRLIGLLREGAAPTAPPSSVITVTAENRQELVIECIRNRWHRLDERGELPGRDDLVGILRTLLSSIETWRSQSLNAQGYLRFLEGFLKNSGVNLRMDQVEPRSIEGTQD
jgi:hypothetical protein